MPLVKGKLTIEEETLPFLMNHLPFVITKAEVELNESHDKIANGLQELKALARGSIYYYFFNDSYEVTIWYIYFVYTIILYNFIDMLNSHIRQFNL